MDHSSDIYFRPGMGGSTPVSLNIRMKVWLETVPVLLHKVNVQHVSIVTHSAGGIYTLNTLAELRSILDPKAPYVALLGKQNDHLDRQRLTSPQLRGCQLLHRTLRS